jgi:hypothetical protein
MFHALNVVDAWIFRKTTKMGLANVVIFEVFWSTTVDDGHGLGLK